jgi:hypothetical protein
MVVKTSYLFIFGEIRNRETGVVLEHGLGLKNRIRIIIK